MRLTHFRYLIGALLIIPSMLLGDNGLVDQETDRSAEENSHLVEPPLNTSSQYEQMRERILYSQTGPNLVGLIEITKDRAIDQSTYLKVKFSLEHYLKRGVRFILIKLDTPGGEVLSTLKIIDLLQKVDVEDHIPVVAWIDNWAVSAGAMIAYACRFIAVSPTALMGAAEPVVNSREGGVQTASEKVNSALRAQLFNLASFYGRNPLIAEAMVDKSILLVKRGDQIIKLDDADQLIHGGDSPDLVISPKGKLLTLTQQQLLEFNVANLEVPHQAHPSPTDEELLRGEWSGEKSAFFDAPFFREIPDVSIISLRDWRLTLFSVLSHPAIASLLLMGMIVGFYIEINTPGFGVMGALALACLSLILLSSFATHAINWIELLLLIAGLGLLTIELLVIPGFGVVGLTGIILALIGLFSLMLPGLADFNLFEWDTLHLVGAVLMQRLAWLCLGVITSVGVVILLARLFRRKLFNFSPLVLHGEQPVGGAHISSSRACHEWPPVGSVGVTLTPMHPSGHVQIEGEFFSAKTRGEFLEAHTSIEVFGFEHHELIVTRAQEADGSS